MNESLRQAVLAETRLERASAKAMLHVLTVPFAALVERDAITAEELRRSLEKGIDLVRDPDRPPSDEEKEEHALTVAFLNRLHSAFSVRPPSH